MKPIDVERLQPKDAKRLADYSVAAKHGQKAEDRDDNRQQKRRAQ